MGDGQEIDEVIVTATKGEEMSNSEGIDKINDGLGAFGLVNGAKIELIESSGKGGGLSPGTMKYLIYANGAGYMTAGITTTSAVIQYGQNPTTGNATRIAVQGLIIGTAFIPGVGWAISLGIGGADMI